MLYLRLVSRSVSQKLTCKDPSNTRDRNERLFDFDEVFSDRIGQTEIFDKVRITSLFFVVDYSCPICRFLILNSRV
jgi:hypothetical protein